MKLWIATGLTAVALIGTGCVSKQTHEATLQQLDETRHSLSAAEQTIDEQRGEIGRNKEAIERSSSELEALQNKKAALAGELEAAQAHLDASQSELNASKAQLETLRQIESETKRRNEIYARFVAQLQKMIDGGRLTVSIEEGRMVINLPENVLFASGSAKLNEEGGKTLREIAGVLGEFAERRFQVEGHTDNIPIKTQGYSNWELSSERALSVVHLMVEAGVAPEHLSAAGFGPFRPRADNETAEGRALNRRIEIVMLPNLEILSSELPKLTP